MNETKKERRPSNYKNLAFNLLAVSKDARLGKSVNKKFSLFRKLTENAAQRFNLIKF
jgi:hypothetical protein